MRTRAMLLSALVAICVVASSVAEEVSVRTVLTGLRNPCGVAVRPTGPPTFQVFVSESSAGRIVCVASDSLEQAQEVVTGFPAAASDKGPPHQMGPLGLLFLDARQLVVGIGAEDDDGALLHVYDVGQPWPIAAEGTKARLMRPDELPMSATNPPGVYALARTRANDYVPDLVVMTAGRVGAPRWLLKSRVQADMLGELLVFADVDPGGVRPTAIAVGPSGRIVVAHVGALDRPGDSWLAFYNPVDGREEMRVEAGLDDVVALAYSPTSERLYAADFALADPSRSGIYRLDDASEPGRPACRAVKVADVRRPTALAFVPGIGGPLFVTTFGDDEESGTLAMVLGEL